MTRKCPVCAGDVPLPQKIESYKLRLTVIGGNQRDEARLKGLKKEAEMNKGRKDDGLSAAARKERFETLMFPKYGAFLFISSSLLDLLDISLSLLRFLMRLQRCADYERKATESSRTKGGSST